MHLNQLSLETVLKPEATAWYDPKASAFLYQNAYGIKPESLDQKSKAAIKTKSATRAVSGEDTSKARLEALYQQAAAQNLGPLVKPGPVIKPGKPIKPEVVAWHDLQSLLDLYKQVYAVDPAGFIKTKPAIKYEAGIKSGVATVDKDAAYKARLAAAYKQDAGQKLAYGINPADLTKTEPAIKREPPLKPSSLLLKPDWN